MCSASLRAIAYRSDGLGKSRERRGRLGQGERGERASELERVELPQKAMAEES